MEVDGSIASRITHYRVGRISLEKILIYFETLLDNLGFKGSIKNLSIALEGLVDVELKKRA